MKAVQRMLGHASAQITLDRYSHLYDDDLEDLADSMDARYGAARCGKPNPARLLHEVGTEKGQLDQAVYNCRPS